MSAHYTFCRNFHRLRHSDWFSRGALGGYSRRSDRPAAHVDVWLVDFFSAPNLCVDDVCSLFVLQLACIVTMVKRFSACRLRTMGRRAWSWGIHLPIQ